MGKKESRKSGRCTGVASVALRRGRAGGVGDRSKDVYLVLSGRAF